MNLENDNHKLGLQATFLVTAILLVYSAGGCETQNRLPVYERPASIYQTK